MLSDWQAHGHDVGSKIDQLDTQASNKGILAQARRLLGMAADHT